MQSRKGNGEIFKISKLFPKNQKGSHVGMILSFIVFITSLIFIYTILEPAINTPKSKQTLLKNLELGLTEQFSSRLITSMIANESNASEHDCLQINNTRINTVGLNAIVKNKTGDIITSQPIGENLIINWAGNETNFKIYYSEEELEETHVSLNCVNVETNYYQGLITWKNQVFASKVIKTVEEYGANYGALKSELGVPLDSDFSFNFKMDNGTEIKTQEINISKEVYVGEFPIQYIDREANIKFGTLRIQVW
jgi:hypothetical protein